MARLREENRRLKSELQSAKEGHQQQLRRADECERQYKDAKGRLSDTQRKLAQTVLDTNKIIQRLEEDCARYKRKAKPTNSRLSTRQGLTMRIPDVNAVFDLSTRKALGDESSAGPVEMIGSGLRRNILDQRMPAPSDLQSKNSRLQQEIKNLKLRIEILGARSCEPWYALAYQFCK